MELCALKGCFNAISLRTNVDCKHMFEKCLDAAIAAGGVT